MVDGPGLKALTALVVKRFFCCVFVLGCVRPVVSVCTGLYMTKPVLPVLFDQMRHLLSMLSVVSLLEWYPAPLPIPLMS